MRCEKVLLFCTYIVIIIVNYYKFLLKNKKTKQIVAVTY